MAPGPTPTLTMSAPASIRSRTPSAATMLPATIGHLRVEGAHRLIALIIDSWWPCAVSTTRRVDARVEQLLGLARDVAVDADGGGDAQPAVRVGGGRVQRGAQRALAGEDAGEAAVGVDGGGVAGGWRASSRLKASRGSMSASSSSRSRDMTSESWVKRSTPVRSGVGDDTDGAAVLVDDDARVVRPLGQQGQRVGDGLVRGEHDRGVEHQVAALDPGDDVGDDVDRDVLRDDHEPAAPGDGLGHPAARRWRSCWRRPAGSWCRCRPGRRGPRPAGSRPRSGSGTMKTSSYVRSYGGWMSLRKRTCCTSQSIRGDPRTGQPGGRARTSLSHDSR